MNWLSSFFCPPSLTVAAAVAAAATVGAGLLFAALPSPASAEDAAPKKEASPQKLDGWKLVWSDEFNYDGLPDPKKWGYEKGYLRNGEKQYYTAERKENARVENGTLIIESRKEQIPIGADKMTEYTSASVTTRGKAEWTYGRVEVRAKLPTGRGMWPAIWMLGTNISDAGWPLCGELDIMENVGYDPDVIHANVHTQKYNHVKHTNKGASVPLEKPNADFHVYSMEWSPEKIEFFLDGNKYFTYENEKSGTEAWPFDSPQYLILNSAIGGGWGGQKGIDESIFPQRYYIDYVRVYKKDK